MDAVCEFWNTYARAARVSGASFRVYAFGDSPDLADELVTLVMSGAKRADARLSRSTSTIPHAGEFGVVLDGRSVPRCIVRTVQVDIKPLRDVDERFAWDDGGGDRSLEWWVSAHTRFFKRQGAREGFSVDADSELVLERFEVVWPPEIADRATYFYGFG